MISWWGCISLLYKTIKKLNYQKFSNNLTITLAIVSIACGVILRFFFIDFHPLSEDELTTLGRVLKHPLAQMLYINKVHDTQQPLFYLLLKLQNNIWEIKTVIQARWLSLSFSLLTLYSFFRFNKEQFGKELALISTGLLSLSFMAIHHANEVRMYSLFLLLSVISLYLLNKIIIHENYSKKMLAQFFVIQILLAYTHHFGFLYFFTNVVCLGFFLNRKKKFNLKVVLLILLAIAMILSPIIYDFIKDFNDIHHYRPKPNLLSLLGQLSYLFSGKYFLLISGIIILLSFMKERNINHYHILIVLPVIVTYLKSMISSPVLEARYLIFILPPFFLLVSKLIVLSKNKEKLFFIFLLLALVNFSIKEKYFQYPYRQNTKYTAEEAEKYYVKNNSKRLVFCNTCPDFYIKKAKPLCLFNEEDIKNFEPKTMSTLVILETEKSICDLKKLENDGFKEIFKNSDKKILILKN